MCDLQYSTESCPEVWSVTALINAVHFASVLEVPCCLNDLLPLLSEVIITCPVTVKPRCEGNLTFSVPSVLYKLCHKP